MPKLPFVDLVTPALATPVTLSDNQSSPLTIITLPTATVKSATVGYSLIRNTSIEVGLMSIATDGTTLSFEQDKTHNSDTGVTFTASISGSDVIIQYTTTNTGFTATLKYSTAILN